MSLFRSHRRLLPMAILCFCGGCGCWRTLPVAKGEVTIERGDTLRLEQGASLRTVRVTNVDLPWLDAVEDAQQGPVVVRVDLRTLDRVETYTFARGVMMTTIAIFGIAAPIGGLGVYAALPKGG